MKLFRYTAFFLMCIILLSCNKQLNKTPVSNGIDLQILNIVDSIVPLCPNLPFITIMFSNCKDSNEFIFINTLLLSTEGDFIPPQIPYHKTDKMKLAQNNFSLDNVLKPILVSKNKNFIGYKEYENRYLIFMNFDSNNSIEKFIQIDSLKLDEVPFEKFNVYDEQYNRQDCKGHTSTEKRYFINENDSLVFYDGKCLFDVEY